MRQLKNLLTEQQALASPRQKCRQYLGQSQ